MRSFDKVRRFFVASASAFMDEFMLCVSSISMVHFITFKFNIIFIGNLVVTNYPRG